MKYLIDCVSPAGFLGRQQLKFDFLLTTQAKHCAQRFESVH